MGCTPSSAEKPVGASARRWAYEHNASEEAAIPVLGAAHTDIVNCLAPGPAPGQWLSSSEDRTVVLFDSVTQRPLERWQGHSRGVNCVVALPGADGGAAPSSGPGALCAISASRDCTLRLWARGAAAPLATLTGHALTVSSVCLPGAGLAGARQCVSGSRDGSVRLWDLATAMEVTAGRANRNVVTCLAPLGPAEPWAVVQGSEDLSVKLWDLRAMGSPAGSLGPRLQYFALCAAVSADGRRLVLGCNGFGGSGCELLLLDLRKSGSGPGQELGRLRPHNHAITACAFVEGGAGAGAGERAGGALVASVSKDGSLGLSHFGAESGPGIGAGGSGGASPREGEGAQAGVLQLLQPSAGAQLTALAALDAVCAPGPGAADGRSGPWPGLVVGSARGAVHTLALEEGPAGSGPGGESGPSPGGGPKLRLRELCHTEALPSDEESAPRIELG